MRDLLGASNAAIGAALERYGLVRETAGVRVSGETALQNALTPTRKLTYEWGARLVAGLFLSRPATDHRTEKGAFNELAEILHAVGAWNDTRRPAPAFIPLDVINHIADHLASRIIEYAPGVGQSKRSAIANALRRCLRNDAPMMGRSWCDMALQLRPAHDLAAAQIIEGLAEVGFGDYYIAPGRRASSFGSVFALLHRERPELTMGMAMPEPIEEDYQRGKRPGRVTNAFDSTARSAISENRRQRES